MVAKINRGASLYGAIIYNQQKVNEDTARIIAGNRMITDSLYDPDRIVRQTMFAFESYLAANRNTEKPILIYRSIRHWTTILPTVSLRIWQEPICRRWATATSPTLSISTRT